MVVATSTRLRVTCTYCRIAFDTQVSKKVGDDRTTPTLPGSITDRPANTPSMCGLFGPQGDKRFDVIGGQVNAAARLPTRGLALSVEAFRALSPSTRERFKKHTPPVTYIPVEDKRPSPMAKG